MTKTIDNSTFHFLKQLSKNNNHDWFMEHKNDYEKARTNVENFIEELLETMSDFDQELLKVDAKKSMFRIYRDVRFSKDKSPYKNNFGARLGMGKGNNPGYYLHIESGKSFAAGGLYKPDSDALKQIRANISENSAEFLEIVEHEKFRNQFRGLSTEQKLLRVPNGFDKNDPMAEYLKLKQYVVKHPIADEQLCGQNAAEEIAEIFNSMHPLNDFLKSSIH